MSQSPTCIYGVVFYICIYALILLTFLLLVQSMIQWVKQATIPPMTPSTAPLVALMTCG